MSSGRCAHFGPVPACEVTRHARLGPQKIPAVLLVTQGGVSITSIARSTLGPLGANLASLAYLFLHYALLVACECAHTRQPTLAHERVCQRASRMCSCQMSLCRVLLRSQQGSVLPSMQ